MNGIPGVLTNIGLTNAMLAESNEGWRIRPIRFGVTAETPGILSKTRTNMLNTWYEAAISAYNLVTSDSESLTIEFVCAVPPGQPVINGVLATTPSLITEIYLTAQTIESGGLPAGDEYLLALGQPQGSFYYHPFGTLRLRLQIKISGVNDISKFQFYYTQAIEIEDHNMDPNAHPPIQRAMAKAGIYVDDEDYKAKGQFWDEKAAFNVSVSNKMLVYKNDDGTYYPAIADSTDHSNVVGLSYMEESGSEMYLIYSGKVDISDVYGTGIPANTPLYLSATVPGEITVVASDVLVGISLGGGTILLKGFSVVTSHSALGLFPGIIQDYAGVYPPPFYLLCDGTKYNISDYPELYTAIGNTWNTDGNGTTTFNVPDLRGRSTLGSGTGSGLTVRSVGQQTIGEETHALTLNENASHSHIGATNTAPEHSHPMPAGSAQDGNSPGNFLWYSQSIPGKATGLGGAHSHTVTINSSGSGTAHNNMQPSAVVNKIIYAGR